MPKITKRTVDEAQPDPAARRFLWDGEVKGFGLLILPSGVKSYVFQYRADGRSRRETLGKHGQLTPTQARDLAIRRRHEVATGHDPLEEKRQRRHGATVASMFEAYTGSEAFAGKAASTRASDAGRIKRHLLPLLGRDRVDDLTPEDIARALAAIRNGVTAVNEKTARGRSRVTGGAAAARKAIVLLRTVLAWAVHEGIAKNNPARHVKTGSDGSRDTILESAADYSRLFRTLDVMESERRIRPPVADVIRVLALTGSRKSEIAALRWRHVDLKRGLVVLPPLEHKSGGKTGKPRVIGLPAAAQAIIARQPPGGPDDFVFRPARGLGPLALDQPWQQVRVEAALPAGIGLHGLRHSFASHFAMSGAQAGQVMAALGHGSMATSARYVHFAEQQQQALAERAASVALAGLTAADDAEVIDLGTRR